MTAFDPWPPDDGAPHTITGHVLHGLLPAPSGTGHRDVWVCLPPGYDGERRFPVVYMQDGQNLFDAATAFGGREWGVDEAIAAGGDGAAVIAVGVANAGDGRINEYSPWPDQKNGGGGGDGWLDWLIGSVKPAIDAVFRTIPAREGTLIAGSSLGGLIALYAWFTRPQVFGGVAALSPALWFARRAIFRVLAGTPRHPGRVYVDTGTREGPAQLLDVVRLRHRLRARGYRSNEDLRVVIERGATHSEEAWARRFPDALRFLLAPADAVRPADDRRRRAAPRTRQQR